MGTPFADLVRDLNLCGERYIDMQWGCDGVRSAAWWNQVANGKPVHPPTAELFPNIACYFNRTERDVAEMVAEQWYGVRPDDKVPTRVRPLVSSIDELSDEDIALVGQFIQRLRKGPVPAAPSSEPVQVDHLLT